MSNQLSRVQHLTLENFTAFEKAAFDFCPGINVFIGPNATGKSHVMKAIYSLLKACETAHQRNIKTVEEFDNILYFKFEGVFRFTEIVSDLIRYGSYNHSYRTYTQGMAEISLEYEDVNLDIQIDSEQTGLGLIGLKGDPQRFPRTEKLEPLPDPVPSIYLPAQEFLSINEGFIAAYTKRESAFDETFYDLSLALNASPLRKEYLIDIQELLSFLRRMMTGEQDGEREVVAQENGRFIFSLPEGELDVHLVAEGYRKIATLYYLLRNGSLTKNSILFWDEPEAHLNPGLIVEVVKVLRMLANIGVQVFITTHDYLLSHELSLLNEYPTNNRPEIKFFALHKPTLTSGVLVEAGQTLAEIEHNPILEEFAAHYERESTLFRQSAVVGESE